MSAPESNAKVNAEANAEVNAEANAEANGHHLNSSTYHHQLSQQ